MIYVTVGNDFRPFDRLLRKMDEIASSLPEPVLIQRGYSTYTPRNAPSFDFVSMDAAAEHILKSRLVVSHAGIGTIILCRQYGIPLLILPRRKTFGEHMNDHQLEIARALEKKETEQIYVVYEEERMEQGILRILEHRERPLAVQNPGKTNLLKALREFIETVAT